MYPEHGNAGERGGDAGERDAIAGVSGCWRVEGGMEGALSPFFVTRRRVSIGARGKHEWALSGLLMPG